MEPVIVISWGPPSILGVVVLDRAGRCFAVILVGFGEGNSAWIRNPVGLSLFAVNLRRATGTAMTIINFRPLYRSAARPARRAVPDLTKFGTVHSNERLFCAAKGVRAKGMWS
jgi:hypothetical protein